jgi:hypothetical protein
MKFISLYHFYDSFSKTYAASSITNSIVRCTHPINYCNRKCEIKKYLVNNEFKYKDQHVHFQKIFRKYMHDDIYINHK